MSSLAGFLEWQDKPMGAFRITVDDVVYYHVRGPAGRSLPSGPAGYSFDKSGKFIGWSADVGDIRKPEALWTKNARWEKITLEDLREIASEKRQ